MGIILSATGSVLDPIMDTENSSASDKGSFSIIKLQGKYIISEDGQVQQEGPLTILCAGSSGVAVGGRVNGHLVAANLVQVMVGRFYA
ncbi:PREDICTED: AT-hook motif nuclear-localized protein 8-like [Nicotiana attenuata]|uniref:AT-hook motif nuclear-localized protein 8-like n=1 Tax=Nicotiana attenuata TaxID=49451 RepID=UPI000904BFF2|nr:PREDICTED: AT-hook motif nuclear-localized protein 8-like [Nicotiana attenuata]